MTQQPIKTKEPVVAFILSLLIAGVGQLYLGQTTKGLVLAGTVLILDIGGVLLSLLLTGLTQAGGGCLTLICCGLPLGISFSLSVLSAIDAYFLAQRVNEGVVLGEWSTIFKEKSWRKDLSDTIRPKE